MRATWRYRSKNEGKTWSSTEDTSRLGGVVVLADALGGKLVASVGGGSLVTSE